MIRTFHINTLFPGYVGGIGWLAVANAAIPQMADYRANTRIRGKGRLLERCIY